LIFSLLYHALKENKTIIYINLFIQRFYILIFLYDFIHCTQLYKQLRYHKVKPDEIEIPIFLLLEHDIAQDETTWNFNCSTSSFLQNSSLWQHSELFCFVASESYL